MTELVNFTVAYHRVLDPDGKLVQELPAFAKIPENLLTLYRNMVLLRTFDTKAIALQRTGKMGTYPSTLGQEAVSVGLGAVMHKDDVLCPAYREYGAQFQRGVKMSEIFAYWGGDERGNCYVDNTDDFPMAVPIGTQCLHAAGVAVAMKYRNEPRVAVSVCGDGATSQGDFYEAMNVAGVWKLPVVFLVQNNQWAISLSCGDQTAAETIAQKAIAAGFTGEQVDGNDIIAVHAVLERALEKARHGGGPTLIEAMTYRLHDHTTADDASRYRPAGELEKARAEEPLIRLRRYLMEQKLWSEAQEKEWQAKCAAEVEHAVEEYLKITPEPITAMFDYLYAELPEALFEQREDAERFLEGHHG
jgi:2-oxoisovalerate dehydrogenase E1 component alpha subunit